MDSNDQYCHSFLKNIAVAVADVAREGYIAMSEKFVSSPTPPYISDHHVIIRFRDYIFSVSCLDDGRVEVKIHTKNANDRYILNTKQEMEQFQKELLMFIDMIRHSVKIGEFTAKKGSKNHSTHRKSKYNDSSVCVA